MSAETKTFKYQTKSCSHNHNQCSHHQYDINEKKTKIVVIISALAMITEIFFGYVTNSMALLSDGWHMASHVFAIGIAWISYAYCRRKFNDINSKHEAENFLSLSGYTSAIILIAVAFQMALESSKRLFLKETINYKEALIITVIGLIINLICAVILHQKNNSDDYNIKAAYLHVLADAFTSLLAIFALFFGEIYGMPWLDAMSGLLGSIIIFKWALGLIKKSAFKLLHL